MNYVVRECEASAFYFGKVLQRTATDAVIPSRYCTILFTLLFTLGSYCSRSLSLVYTTTRCAFGHLNALSSHLINQYDTLLLSGS